MGTYIIRRLLQMIPVILGATFLIFAMVFALPGDPLAGKCGERPCPPQYAAAFREKYNLNDPLPVQYGKYLGNLAKGDLGETYNGIKVTEQLKLRYPITAKLAVMAILFESILGHPRGRPDRHQEGRVPRQPRPRLDPRRDLDPGLRHRWSRRSTSWASSSGLFPVTVTSLEPLGLRAGCCPPWCWARSRWPTSPG